MDENKKDGINDPVVDERKKGGGINDPVLYEPPQKRKVVCKNCKQAVEPNNMMCPECGHYLNENKVTYQPVSASTARKIRWILSIILVAVFILLVAFGVFKLRACEADDKITYFKRPNITAYMTTSSTSNHIFNNHL